MLFNIPTVEIGQGINQFPLVFQPDKLGNPFQGKQLLASSPRATRKTPDEIRREFILRTGNIIWTFGDEWDRDNVDSGGQYAKSQLVRIQGPILLVLIVEYIRPLLKGDLTWAEKCFIWYNGAVSV
jgi:hypothetical protein